MAVIKGNPAGKDAAMKFIASAQDPQRQLVIFERSARAPANPATDALIRPTRSASTRSTPPTWPGRSRST